MIKEHMAVGWGEQLENWKKHGNYRDNAHLLLSNEVEKEKTYQMLLDIGCGSGCLLKERHFKKLDYLGVDLSDEIIKFHQENTGLNVIKGDVTNLPIDSNFADLVICHGLVEHLPDPQVGLKELSRVCRKDGTALISVPSKWSLFPILVPLWYFSGGRHRFTWIEMVGRMYSKNSFRKILVESGWEVEEIVSFKAGSFLDWARIPFSQNLSRLVERVPVLSSLFGIMLCARCKAKKIS